MSKYLIVFASLLSLNAFARVAKVPCSAEADAVALAITKDNPYENCRDLGNRAVNQAKRTVSVDETCTSEDGDDRVRVTTSFYDLDTCSGALRFSIDELESGEGGK